jgi:hypothetical protein
MVTVSRQVTKTVTFEMSDKRVLTDIVETFLKEQYMDWLSAVVNRMVYRDLTVTIRMGSGGEAGHAAARPVIEDAPWFNSAKARFERVEATGDHLPTTMIESYEIPVFGQYGYLACMAQDDPDSRLVGSYLLSILSHYISARPLGGLVSLVNVSIPNRWMSTDHLVNALRLVDGMMEYLASATSHNTEIGTILSSVKAIVLDATHDAYIPVVTIHLDAFSDNRFIEIPITDIKGAPIHLDRSYSDPNFFCVAVSIAFERTGLSATTAPSPPASADDSDE